MHKTYQMPGSAEKTAKTSLKVF